MDKDKKDNELKPCPFCRSKAIIKGHKIIWFYIECVECVCSLGKYFDSQDELYAGFYKTKQEAIDAWNTRKGE